MDKTHTQEAAAYIHTEVEVVIMDQVRVEKDMVHNHAKILPPQAQVHLPTGYPRKEGEAREQRVHQPFTDAQLLVVGVAQFDEVVLGQPFQDGVADPAQVQEREDDAKSQEGKEPGSARVHEGLDLGHVTVPEFDRFGRHFPAQQAGVDIPLEDGKA